MHTQALASQLENLALFRPYLNGPLAEVANHVPKWPIQPSLQLYGARSPAYTPNFALPAAVLALPGVAGLSAAALVLLGRAAHQLRLLDIEVVSVQPLPYGLRLHLHRELEQGQVVVYHSKNGTWSAVDTQGARTRLTAEAHRQLKVPLPATEAEAVELFPDDARLDLVAAYYHLLYLACQAGWRVFAAKLLPNVLSVWLFDGCGLVQVRLHHGAGAAPLHGEVWRAYAQTAADTAHDFLRHLVAATAPAS